MKVAADANISYKSLDGYVQKHPLLSLNQYYHIFSDLNLAQMYFL